MSIINSLKAQDHLDEAIAAVRAAIKATLDLREASEHLEILLDVHDLDVDSLSERLSVLASTCNSVADATDERIVSLIVDLERDAEGVLVFTKPDDESDRCLYCGHEFRNHTNGAWCPASGHHFKSMRKEE